MTVPDGAPVGRVVVMGVSGSGKSTVGAALAAALGVPFAEGDDVHPQANRDKMAAGVPLTDDDRRPWLAALRDWAAGQPAGCVLSCSALRRAYREVLRRAGDDVVFVHLAAPREVFAARMAARRGHYMPTSLLDSQLAALEPLQPDELGVVLDARADPAELVVRAGAWLRDPTPERRDPGRPAADKR